MAIVDRMVAVSEIERQLKIADIKPRQKDNMEAQEMTVNSTEGQSLRGIKWNYPTEPLDLEALSKVAMEVDDAYDVESMSDMISESANHNLCKPSIMQNVCEPLVCQQLTKTYNFFVDQQVPESIPMKNLESDKSTYPIWSGLLMQDTEIFNEYGKIVNDVIQAIMAEITKYNDDRGCDLKGLWDVPRFISMGVGQGGEWFNDLGIGAEQSLQNMSVIASKEAEWNGQPPPSTRKYSTLVCLSDGGSYDGGDMELVCDEVKTIKLNMGDVIIYPSFIAARFLPVTRGNLVLLKLYSNGKAYV